MQLERLAARYPKRRAPADPAQHLPCSSLSTRTHGPRPQPSSPGTAAPRAAAGDSSDSSRAAPASIGSRGSAGTSGSTTAIALCAAPLLTAQENWITGVYAYLLPRRARVRKPWQRVWLPGTARMSPREEPASPAQGLQPRGAAARYRDSQLSRQPGSPLSSTARGSGGAKAGKGLEAPRRGRGSAGGAGTDLASGAVPQHHQLELVVRTLLLLRVRHDLYGPGETEEAESSREELGAGARTKQGEERARLSRSRQ